MKSNIVVLDWLCWGLSTRQPLWANLCRLQEKGRKEIGEIVEEEETIEEMKERDREERGTVMKVKKRRNKNIPPLPIPAIMRAGLAQL